MRREHWRHKEMSTSTWMSFRPMRAISREIKYVSILFVTLHPFLLGIGARRKGLIVSVVHRAIAFDAR
ncbi:hypothetical protein BV22DRAFT_1027697 [Leucogyrophana mollusca]|uniref:Uncharacterized protein n=1 Tax=Leucogyrophana mollusca TaxID=85980 RepID=A0ACB8BZI0_9AGAM|nr:hypothetical protein BV22DRAFT_1027697 [Leucogyrophana mollusca]